MSILEELKRVERLPKEYLKMTMSEKEQRIKEIKQKFGDKLLIPGHHYQRDEVIQFADVTGDSLQLAQVAQQNQSAEFIVFCGVHFMAETADMLTNHKQKVILPDLRAGCSMADMATITQTEKAWEKLINLFDETILPITYVNSTAAIKAFCGEHGGATVTSSNAKKMVEWAFTQKQRLLFLPDQHLGRNTAYDLGISLHEMVVWDPLEEVIVNEYQTPLQDVKVILWKGHCSVHEKFTVGQIEDLRKHRPEMNILVHPECTYEVVQKADLNGSTHFIIETIKKAPKGSAWAIGTEMNLVSRLAKTFKEVEIISLNATMCACLTMNRIDIDHLLWTLEDLEKGNLRNVITVDERTTAFANLALERMLKQS
ncbi:quinolinate synthase NadA [Alkalihalobacillus pseudalcaliphilus]|uniref:quinolinate synthase NadA n=1 Tax=Alkalihalobacillus pseudalcaliphilus TaxID=79884 RepID=UPI00064D7540|nr:quinolinate synthase NadA [Alkalihalobacillus pseudalcaliphilus]KMK75709.1 quinolinate synthetase [Alkalihalobacillus pseudalcaliphilus]